MWLLGSVIRTIDYPYIDYPNYRLSEISLVPISSDNRRSAVRRFIFFFSDPFSHFFFITSLLFLFITSYSFPIYFLPVFFSSPFSYPHTFPILNHFISFNIEHNMQLRIPLHLRCQVGKTLLSFKVNNQIHPHSNSKTLTPSVSVKCTAVTFNYTYL